MHTFSLPRPVSRRHRASFLPVAAGLLLTVGIGAPLPRAQADPASHRAKVEELFSLMKLDQMMANQRTQVRQMMSNAFSQMMERQGLSPEQTAAMQQTQTKIGAFVDEKLTWEGMKPEFVQVYQEAFTEPELNDIVTFYKTPTGRKLVDKTPDLTAKGMQIGQRRVMEIMPEVQRMAQESAQAAMGAKAGTATPATPAAATPAATPKKK